MDMEDFPWSIYRFFLRGLVVLLFLVGGFLVVAALATAITAPNQFGPFLAQPIEIVSSWLLFSFSVGLVSMIIIDTGKYLLRLRGLFFERAVPRLTGLSSTELAELLPPSARVFNLFPTHLDMPIEQFTAQLSSRLDQAINSVELLRSRADDLSPAERHRQDDEFDLLLAFLGQRKAGLFERRYEIMAGIRPEESHDDFLDARMADMRMRVDQKLDSLQTTLTSQWSLFMRLSASILSLILTALLSVSFPVYALPATPLVIAGLLVASFVTGGYFASLSHDLLTFLRRGRRR
jgi:hypothetical protein